MAKQKGSIHFEQSLSKLESIVAAMESGDLTLEESLKSFEEGVNLTRQCQQALTEAEQKVELLLKTDSGIESLPFSQNEE